MAAWYFLIYLLVIPSCLVAGQSSSFGLKGGKAFLKTDIAGHPDEIQWKFKGNTVVKCEGQEQRVYGPYENRITLNCVTAELTIAQLRLEDSGDFELEIEKNNALYTSYHELEVMDKVSRPTISCTMNGGGSLNISGELVCSAEHQPSLKFEWGARGKLQLGPQLQVPLGDEHDDEVYSCSVSNQLSKETTTFTAKDCYPEESSSVAPITVAVIIIIVLVLLLVCVAIFWLKRHNKACFAEDDLEKQSSPGSKEGLNKKEAQNDEKRNRVHRESTLSSKQTLFQGHNYRSTCSDKQNEETDSDHEELEEMPKKGHVERIKKTLFGSKGDADAVQPSEPPQEKAPLINQSDSVEENDPEPAGVSDHVSEDESSPEGPESPEHPEPKMPKQEEMPNKGHVKSVKKCLGLEDKDDHHEGDADAVQPSEPPQEEAPLINQSDSVEENDPEPAGVLDHVSEEEESSPEGPESPEHPEAEAQSPHVDASMADQALSLNEGNKDPAAGQKDVANSDQVTGESAETKVGESDSSGEEKGNDSGNTGEDKTTSTDCEQKGSRTSTEPEENNTSEESDKGNDKPGSEGEDTIETKAANSHQPQSQSTKPDHSNTDPGQQSSDAARAQPDEEEEECKTCPDSHDTEGQSDKGEEKTVVVKNEA